MLARHAAKTCDSVAELVATAQNIGHTDVLTTLRSYGQISGQYDGKNNGLAGRQEHAWRSNNSRYG